MSYTMEQLQNLRGRPVYSSDGEQIGTVQDTYTDIETGLPEWIGAGTGFLRMKRVIIPVEGAEIQVDSVRVPYDKDVVTSAPDFDDERIDENTEHALAQHYGLGYSEERSSTGLPTGGNISRTDDGEIIRSEEELAVGKREREAGRVRLRKYVLTEPVEEQVELRKERAEIVREPIDADAAPQARIGEEEVGVSLTEEEAVVEKRTVPKERVRVSKEQTTETETVRGDLRKEEIVVDGDDA